MANVGKFGDFADGMLTENAELMNYLKSGDASMTRGQFIEYAVSQGMKKTTAGAYWQRNKKHLGKNKTSGDSTSADYPHTTALRLVKEIQDEYGRRSSLEVDIRREYVMKIDFANSNQHYMLVSISKVRNIATITHKIKPNSKVAAGFSSFEVSHEEAMAAIDRVSASIARAKASKASDTQVTSHDAAGDAARDLLKSFSKKYHTGQVESSEVRNGWDAIIAVVPGKVSFIATFHPNANHVEFFSVTDEGEEGKVKKSIGRLTYVDNADGLKMVVRRLVDALEKQKPISGRVVSSSVEDAKVIPGRLIRGEVENAAKVIRQESAATIERQYAALMERMNSIPAGSRNRNVLENLLPELRYMGEKIEELTKDLETKARLLH